MDIPLDPEEAAARAPRRRGPAGRPDCGWHQQTSVLLVESCLVITNEGAGTVRRGEPPARPRRAPRPRASVEVVATSNPGELDGVLHRAGSRRIVVAGGDGSLHAVVAALHRRNDLADSVLGLIPLGTGNDFARCMDIPLDPEEAARRCSSTARCARSTCSSTSSAGRRQQRPRRRRRPGQPPRPAGRTGSARSARQGQPRQARLPDRRLPGRLPAAPDPAAGRGRRQGRRRRRRPVLMVAIGNGTSVGGGAELTPEADPEDGRVDVMISRSVGPLAKFGYAVQRRPRAAPRARRRARTCAASRSRSRARVLLLGRRRDLRAGAARAAGASCRRRTPWCCPERAHSQPRRDRLDPGLEARVDAELGHHRRRSGGGRCAG